MSKNSTNSKEYEKQNGDKFHKSNAVRITGVHEIAGRYEIAGPP
jgi:hypothetical protein